MCTGLIGMGAKDKNISKVMNKSGAGQLYRKVSGGKKLNESIEKKDRKVRNLF